MHPTNFGCEKIVCPYVHPIHGSECELSHLLTWESKVNVVFNFFISVYFCFSFVSNSLASIMALVSIYLITIPKNKGKTKIN